MSLKQRLLALVVAMIMLVIAALSGIAYWQMRTQIVDGVNKEIEASVRGNREALSRWIAQRKRAWICRGFSADPAAPNGTNIVLGKSRTYIRGGCRPLVGTGYDTGHA